MKRWWLGLDDLQQRVFAGLAALVAIALLWAFVWHPVQSAQQDLRQQVFAAQASLQEMQLAANEAQRLQQGGSATPLDRAGQSMLALADSSAREAGLGGALKRVEPISQQRVNVWFERVAFNSLADWLLQIGQRYGVGSEEFVIDRADGVGLVNARITLVDTELTKTN